MDFALGVCQARGANRVAGVDVVLAALDRVDHTRLDPVEIRRAATTALLEAVPEPRKERIENARRALDVRYETVRPREEIDPTDPRVRSVVDAAEELAAGLGSGEIWSHHLAAVALDEPIPPAVLDALGVGHTSLRRALRDRIATRWPAEPPDVWDRTLGPPAPDTAPTPDSSRSATDDEPAVEAAVDAAIDRDAGVMSDAESAVDLLGFADDVGTMARLLAATSTTPPLSVALMGNWGSGKSSFMTQVQGRVDALARSARLQSSSTYVGHIRQVRFNAWHYSDDHLWVGLVEHLFRELRDGRPTSAAVDEDDLLERERDLEEKRTVRDDLERQLGQIRSPDPVGWWAWLDQPRRTWLTLKAAGGDAVREWKRARLRATALLMLAGLLVVAGVVLGDQISAWFTALGWIGGVTTAAAAVRERITTSWTLIARHTDEARRKLEERRDATNDEIAEAEEDLRQRDPARQLERLLEEIAATDRYEGYRGLTGRIHHDLKRLSDNIAKATTADRSSLRRIVLYVDDLDRCVSSRVVEVLQALNLLLTLPLFLVVVAVDPRWLLRALDEHHDRLLNPRPTITTEGPLPVAPNHGRPLDYLDKIFHVPYAVSPMQKHAEDYLRTLLPSVVSPTAPASGDDGSGATHGASGRMPLTTGASPRSVPESPADEPTTGTSTEDTPTSPTNEPSEDAEPAPPTVEGLALDDTEVQFIPLLAVLIPTPRGVKKLANLYRLLRISIPERDTVAFLGSPGPDGPYQAAAVLLAALIAAPGQARALLEGLSRPEPLRESDDIGKESDDITGVLLSLASAGAPVAADAASFITSTRAEGVPIHGDTATYRRWAPVVARYSFDTYDLFAQPHRLERG
ncbi:P-loop NTPase fold protein [Actinomycetospora sp. CA-101289]|uniref:P-loop NTPase fold protein n=1 Tax=Actinomycetospora sp. CA-101289 TaxID=3239893 RepID=UPI003D98413F